MGPGSAERREYQYVRRPTRTLLAGFDVARGEVVDHVGATCTEEDFVSPRCSQSVPRRAAGTGFNIDVCTDFSSCNSWQEMQGSVQKNSQVRSCGRTLSVPAELGKVCSQYETAFIQGNTSMLERSSVYLPSRADFSSATDIMISPQDRSMPGIARSRRAR